MQVTRDLEKILQKFSKFPVVVLLGPRQSGKTTLVKKTFPKHTYLNLEDPELLAFVTEDPKRFLRTYENEDGVIIDEFQHAPQLLSYLQIESDEKQRPGYFVLTGSQNFLMNEAITQSLAGRAGILHLLPLSIHELMENKLLPTSVDALLIEGGYPRIHAQNFLPQELFPSYIQTYLERDVRQLINVDNLRTFQMFMKLCAGRVGQLLNITDIATNCGINQKTAHQWLFVLEASYIIFLLKPHFNNFNKRIIKTPKLYFYDTGLVSSLLGIRSDQELASSHFRGPLFESLIVSDMYKQYYNRGLTPPLYFWRDHNGRIEVDLLVDRGTSLIPIEIKSGETIVGEFFEPIQKWSAIAEHNPEDSYIIYGGQSTQKRSTGTVLNWQAAGILVASIEQ